MSDRTPTTAAGRRLVADATDHPIWASAMPGYVLAIEAEAKAEARAPLDVERKRLVADAVAAAALVGLYLPALCYAFDIPDPLSLRVALEEPSDD